MTYCCFQKQILDFPLSLQQLFFKLCRRNSQRLHYQAFLCVLQTLFRNIATKYVSEMGVLLTAPKRQFRGNMKRQKCSLGSEDGRGSGLLQPVAQIPSIITGRAVIILLQHWAILRLHKHSVKFTYLF